GAIYQIEVAGEKYIMRLHIQDDGRQVFKADMENMADEIPFAKQVKIIGQARFALKNLDPIEDY
ncbi:MAG: hypothetical protein LBB59_09080, partial [Campylobacteraceae bacterium]|nr:hypothetical protein [Campylobacteraceae bacterium]